MFSVGWLVSVLLRVKFVSEMLLIFNAHKYGTCTH